MACLMPQLGRHSCREVPRTAQDTQLYHSSAPLIKLTDPCVKPPQICLPVIKSNQKRVQYLRYCIRLICLMIIYVIM